MTTKTIKSGNVHNNGSGSRINANFSDGTTGCERLTLTDLKRFLNKEVTELGLAEEYHQIKNQKP